MGWRMKQDGGMRAADLSGLHFYFLDDMKYYANFEADAVIRENDSGERFIKTIGNLSEQPASKDNKEAWGIPSFGIYNYLEPITKQDYEDFGITWDWSPETGERRSLRN